MNLHCDCRLRDQILSRFISYIPSVWTESFIDKLSPSIGVCLLCDLPLALLLKAVKIAEIILNHSSQKMHSIKLTKA